MKNISFCIFNVSIVFLIHLTCIFYFQHIVESDFFRVTCHHDNNYLQVQQCIYSTLTPPTSSSFLCQVY